jgi:glucosamine-6-phosphate deaminase
MSIRQILKSKTIICSVPEARKAAAVKNALQAAVSPEIPASILREHPDTYLYLDEASAGDLEGTSS